MANLNMQTMPSGEGSGASPVSGVLEVHVPFCAVEAARPAHDLAEGRALLAVGHVAGVDDDQQRGLVRGARERRSGRQRMVLLLPILVLPPLLGRRVRLPERGQPQPTLALRQGFG